MLSRFCLRLCSFCLLVSASSSAVYAVGTAAGAKVHNSVEVSFQIGDDPRVFHTERANEVFTVSEVIRSNVSSLAPAGIATPTPGKDVPLGFQLTNTGNGDEAFHLLPQVNTASDFSADVTRVWVESNGRPGWQPDDTPYDVITGVGLEADESIVVYVVADIPADLADQARGEVALTATSTTPGASLLTMGEAIADGGDNGIEAVVAQDDASHQDSGSYVVSGIRLKINKEIIAVNDPYQGNRVMPGAEVTYLIKLLAEGRGTAKDLHIHDPAPENMSYKRHSLVLNEAFLTDDVGDDGGHFDALTDVVWFTPGTISAPLTLAYTLVYVVD